MPVFEYQCKSCNTRYEIYHKSTKSEEDAACPACNSKDNKKLFSSFAAAVNSRPDHGCASGKCEMPFTGGCNSGMCGLN